MAKREITAASSPTEIRTAQEQLAKAQQELKQVFQQKFAGKSFKPGSFLPDNDV